MAELKYRIENVLNETRILLLGGQVLLGFTYTGLFRAGIRSLAARGADRPDTRTCGPHRRSGMADIPGIIPPDR
ncbi:MAG: hypothetical protein DMG73_15520 [Acidobacteria bacterium]|nr:MAG: hypothetical protein DMG73_15520 [Acidobacteriota bacterium]